MNAATLPIEPASPVTPESAAATEALSAQELAIESGRRTLHENVSERVLRWAKALKHVAENIPVTIFDDELIVGRPNTWLGRYGLVYGELDGSLLKAALETYSRQQGQKGAVVVSDEDRRAIEDVLYPYWNGRDFGTTFVRALPEATRFFFFGPDRDNASATTGVGMASAVWRHSQNWAHDFAKILNQGCAGIKAEAEARLAAIDEPRDVVEKQPFLEAVVLTCDAMTTWARRYSALAAALARRETNAVRRRELEQITIGGQTADGRDATNELSYVMLDSARPLQSSYPELAARIHAGTPDRFLHAVVEAIKDGKGTPKVLNDEQIVPFYLANGATVEEALDYAGSGCIESRLVNRETQVTGNAGINYGSLIEMTLRDGRVKA